MVQWVDPGLVPQPGRPAIEVPPNGERSIPSVRNRLPSITMMRETVVTEVAVLEKKNNLEHLRRNIVLTTLEQLTRSVVRLVGRLSHITANCLDCSTLHINHEQPLVRAGPRCVGVVHPTQLLANRHLVKLGLIKKSERKKTLSIIDRRHTARNPPTIERSVRIVKRGNPGCGLTRR
ncbi:hypothetical protein EVAR_69532_1 [Eumeta japonica]|uniref:Uncharacterized protein n=1 Tax=Eumeta variegata TaxID=151549 RepID=A0A4C1SKP4_EUMVA|nr:hypothetical protein EVAR_69532_1 [Eumeta japonica]